MSIASAGDWTVAALLVALILAWWAFLAWWISRFGGRETSARFESPHPPEEALRAWLEYYGTWLWEAGYTVVDQHPERVAFEGRYRPRWEVAVAYFLFPVGLIALLGSLPAHLVATAAEGGVLVEGKVHRRIARELERDADEARRSGAPATS